DKKINKNLKFILTYANLTYNQEVIEGKVDVPVIYAHVGVVEATYKLNMRNALRMEAQLLDTDEDNGSWGTGIIEYTYAPHWFIAVMDQYNFDNPKGGDY